MSVPGSDSSARVSSRPSESGGADSTSFAGMRTTDAHAPASSGDAAIVYLAYDLRWARRVFLVDAELPRPSSSQRRNDVASAASSSEALMADGSRPASADSQSRRILKVSP